MTIKKLSIKQLVGIGSIVGTVSIGSVVTFNQDFQTFVAKQVEHLAGPTPVDIEREHVDRIIAAQARTDSLLALLLAQRPTIIVVAPQEFGHPVPIDSLEGSEAWLRLLWPWLKEGS